MPADNTKEENKERRFLIDPNSYQKAQHEADERGLSVISINLFFEFQKQILSKKWPGVSKTVINSVPILIIWLSLNGKQLNLDRKNFIEEKINVIKEKK